MQQQDVAELLSATASDAGAVAQYLVSIDSEELNGLLDRFVAHEAKKKNDQQRGDWLALVQLLLRSQSARLRTATRIIQLVWNGSSSELECMQWLTEISLGYLGALEEESNSSYDATNSSSSSVMKTRLRLAAIADEVRMLLRILFELLSDGIEAHGTANARKALPQMLSLLPILLGMLVELTSSSNSNNTEKSDHELHENLVKLLELPWSTKTIPLLLDLLKESASIVSASGWSQLQETMERMVTGTEVLPSESTNPIIRECISIASVTGNCHWINIARHLFRKLPPRLRQEAEFNLQMVRVESPTLSFSLNAPVHSPCTIIVFSRYQCLHQSQNAVSLVCESIRTSLLQSESSGVDDDSEPPEGELRLSLDWRDLVFLFHALQVSKPILHHRTTSSRIATDATIFTEIEKLTWAIFRLDLAHHQCEASRDPSHTLDLPKYLAERVTQILTFGGKQVHSREWKALLLMDFAFYWMESEEVTRSKKPVVGLLGNEDKGIQDELLPGSSAVPSKGALARLLLLAVFQTAPEIRSEMLSNLFEGTKSPERVQATDKALDKLFRSQSVALFPHLNAIQDWLRSVALQFGSPPRTHLSSDIVACPSVLFQSHFSSARTFFLMASQLATAHKDLYIFLMVFLRKLLSVSNPAHQQFAIDLWCSWLERGLRFDALQEEEIVSALKSSLLVCQEAHAWTLGRLEQMFRLETGGKAKIQLRRSSWEELHRLLSSELSQFIQPASSSHLNGEEYDDNGDESEEADEYSSSQRHRFRLGALDRFYQQNSSADGAAAVGLVFQKALSCLLSFESAALAAQSTAEDALSLSLPLVGADIMHWIMDFVSNWEFFFHWISQSSEDKDDEGASDFGAHNSQRASGAKALDKKVMWRLLSRIGVASALCSVAIEQLLRRRHDSNGSDGSDHKGASMWPLLDVQLCLHRLLRKLMTTHGASVDVKQSKEYFATSFYGISSIIDARSAQILGDISSRLVGESPSEASESVASVGTEPCGCDPGEISLDSVLFVLDSCCNGTAGSESRNHISTAEARGGVLKALLNMYLNVRDQAFPNTDSSDSAESTPDPRSVFTVYADSLVLKFPKSLRHLVAMPKNAKHVVLLDAKAAEDILVRVFAAIGRVLDEMVEESGAKATDRRVYESMVVANGELKSERGGGGLVALAVVLLYDLRAIMAVRELSKLKVTTVLLVKRLCDLGADVAASSTTSSSSYSEGFAPQMLQLSSVSYNIMCEHVVYHVPLLRALLSVCFSVHLGKSVESVVKIAGSMEGFLLASGFEIALLRTLRALSRRKRKASKRKDSLVVLSSPEPYANQEPVTPSKRRRLRQAAIVVHDSELHDLGDQDESDDEDESVHPQPHLASSDAQSAGILALLALLESVQSTLFKQLSTRKNADQQTRVPSSPQSNSSNDTVLCAHIYEFVLRALLTTKDASWVNNTKVLLKLLSVIEWSLRIGKASCFVGGSGSSSSNSKRLATTGENWQSESCIDILDGAVQIGLHARVWMNLLKESINESATKTRISATSLKIDVFLLGVPQIVRSFSRETLLTDPLRERIRAMLSLVTDQMTPMGVGATPSKKKKANAHMIGVVPIVKKRKKRLRSRHPYIDDWLRDEDGSDAYADLEDFIE